MTRIIAAATMMTLVAPCADSSPLTSWPAALGATGATVDDDGAFSVLSIRGSPRDDAFSFRCSTIDEAFSVSGSAISTSMSNTFE
jgi:hypothetical protein